MTDILCGLPIQAADWPATVQAYENTEIDNTTATSFTKGTPVCELTFTAPTTGRVMLYVGGSARNNSYNGTTNTDYIIMAAEVRQTNSSGSVVVALPTSTLQGEYTCRWAGITKNFNRLMRASVLDGLTPGATYYVSLQYRSNTGAGTADLSIRQLIVRPLP